MPGATKTPTSSPLPGGSSGTTFPSAAPTGCSKSHDKCTSTIECCMGLSCVNGPGNGNGNSRCETAASPVQQPTASPSKNPVTTCIKVNAVCSNHVDCCDGLSCNAADNGMFRCREAPPIPTGFAPCKESHDKCEEDSECCSGLVCTPGPGNSPSRCKVPDPSPSSFPSAAPAPFCLGKNKRCTNGADECCADSFCQDKNGNAPSTCTECKVAGRPCVGQPKECCGSLTCSVSSKKCCYDLGFEGCEKHHQCCSGFCDNSICTLAPTASPTASPIDFIKVREEHIQSVGVPGTAVFVSAFLALAAFFFVVRRRATRNQYKTAEEVRKNRKFASRKSITTFMQRLEKSKEDILIDPQRLDLGRVIGMGSHGVVYEGLYQGMDVAVKELVLEDDEKDAKDSRQRFLQEMLALHRLRHPNIIRLIGVGALAAEDQLSRTFFFVMELAKCSLRDILQDDTMRVMISTLSKTLSLAKQVCDGLAYMHSMDLIHLDVKPENILITEDGLAKLCDLGLSEVACAKPRLPDGKENVAENYVDPTLQELQGTSPYIAPELVTDYRENATKYPVTCAADTYAFAIVLWELLHAPLCPHPLSWDPYRILVEVKYNNYRPNIDTSLPETISAIVRRCWSSTPSERPDLRELSKQFDQIIINCETSSLELVSPIVVHELHQIRTRNREFSRSAML